MVKKRVLLIEDDRFVVSLYEQVLSGDQFELDLADDGQVGLQKALEKKYDLIILDLDIRNPKKEGIEVLTELKQDEENKLTPVVILSSMKDEDLIEQCLARGALSYIIKGNNSASEIKAQIDGFLSQTNNHQNYLP